MKAAASGAGLGQEMQTLACRGGMSFRFIWGEDCFVFLLRDDGFVLEALVEKKSAVMNVQQSKLVKGVFQN